MTSLIAGVQPVRATLYHLGEQASDEEVDDLRRQGEHHSSSRPAANGHAVAATATDLHSRQHSAQHQLSYPTSPEGWDRAETHSSSSRHSEQADTHSSEADVRAVSAASRSPSSSDHRPPTVSATTAWTEQSHSHSPTNSSVADFRSAGGPADSAPADVAVVTPADLFPSSHVQRWSPLLAAYFPFGAQWPRCCHAAACSGASTQQAAASRSGRTPPPI